MVAVLEKFLGSGILITIGYYQHRVHFSVVSSADIENELPDHEAIEDINNTTVSLECQQCFNKFDSNVKVVTGDPRNIALIGHWDGWQPFSTSAKHSSGKINDLHAPACEIL